MIFPIPTQRGIRESLCHPSHTFSPPLGMQRRGADRPVLPPSGSTQMFNECSRLGINGSHFTNISGNMNVYSQFDHGPVRDPLSQLPDLSVAGNRAQDGLDSDSESYCGQLLRCGRGFPLYLPGPGANLPQEYQRHGVAIGDVGSVTPEGAFDFFFNIYLPVDDSINGIGTPENFRPLTPRYNLADMTPLEYSAEDYVSTRPSLFKLDDSPPESELHTMERFVFDCCGPQGAVLTIPFGSRVEKLANLETMRRYARENAESWYKYANGVRGRRLTNGSLYLVTGWEKAPVWGRASFEKARSAFRLAFEPQPMPTPAPALGVGASMALDDRYNYKYRWTAAGPARTKSYGSVPQDTPSNQTVFIHGFSISLGASIWSKFFKDVEISQIVDSRLGRSNKDWVPYGPQGSTFSWIFGCSGGSGSAGGQQHVAHQDEVGGEVVDDVEGADLVSTQDLFHPSRVINDYIFRKCPDAEVVMSHDDDWRDILHDGGATPVVDWQETTDLVYRACEGFTIVEEDGLATIRHGGAEREGDRRSAAVVGGSSELDDKAHSLHGESISPSVDPSEDERSSGAATPLAGMYRSCSPVSWLQPGSSSAGDESTPSISSSSPIEDITTITQLAWNLYLQCEESSQEFHTLTKDLGSLHSVLLDLGEHLQGRGQEYEHQMARSATLLETCKNSLDELDTMLHHSDSLTMMIHTWQGIRDDVEKISEIRRKLISSVTLLASFQSELLNSSTARIEKRLNGLMGQDRGHTRASSSRKRTSRNDSTLWTALFSDLQDLGISPTERPELVVSLLQQAVAADSSLARSSNRSLTPIADHPDEAQSAGSGSRNMQSHREHSVANHTGGSSERVQAGRKARAQSVDDHITGLRRRHLLHPPSAQSFATSSSRTLDDSSEAGRKPRAQTLDNEVNRPRRLLTSPSVQSFATSSTRTLDNSSGAGRKPRAQTFGDEVNRPRRLLTSPSVQSFATSSSRTLGISSSASSIYSVSSLDLSSSKKSRPKKGMMGFVKKLLHKQPEMAEAAVDEGDLERVSRLAQKGMDVNAVDKMASLLLAKVAKLDNHNVDVEDAPISLTAQRGHAR